MKINNIKQATQYFGTKFSKENIKPEEKCSCKICNLNDMPQAHYSKISIQGVSNVNQDNYLKHTQSNYSGCLLGGAIGDALGWPVEFRRLSDIVNKYGPEGITDLKIVGNKAEITDDTQMTVFTADGLLKSALNGNNTDSIPDMNIVFDSYKDWLDTQYSSYKNSSKGWIANIKDLWDTRAPGSTCMGAVRNGIPGSIENQINPSKGCGGVMRVAPVGLMYYKNPDLAFEVGARCAALTHGSPDAYLPAGVLASIIADVIQGENIEKSVDNAILRLKTYEGYESTLNFIELAKKYANSDIDPRKAIYNIGEGWRGDEAIGIAVYCVLKEPNDFKKALIMAVNHNGDSDSTGAIVGNILGAYLGEDKIPQNWKKTVELSNELSQLANDLYVPLQDIEDVNERYNIN